MTMKIVAFVDHEIGYRLLEKLISSQSVFGIELVSVVTTQDNGRMWWPGVAELCQQSKIPLHIYRDPFTATSDYANVDWYFLLSWSHIVPTKIIEKPRFGVVNLHYSLLPEYRGVYPVNWAIIDGKDTTGVTYHIVDEKIDAGYIICQKAIPILLSDTARTLQLRLDNLAYELFDDLLKAVIRGSIKQPGLVQQYETLGSYKSRIDFIELSELDLDCEYRAIDLLNLLRGMTFLPDSRNLYVVDPATGDRIYISVRLDSSK